MSIFTDLLAVSLVFWGFITAYLIFLTTRLQRMERDLSVLQKTTVKED